MENTSGVCLSSLKCKSHTPKEIYMYAQTLEETPKGEGALLYMGYIISLCWGKGLGFQVGYQFSPVDITYNCIHGVIFRQSG